MKMNHSRKYSGLKNGVYFLVMLVLLGVFIEVCSIILIHVRYHHYIEVALQDRRKPATYFILHKLFVKSHLPSYHGMFAKPSPFRIPDSIHGYRNNSGSFEISYQKKSYDTLQKFRFYVRILPDGSRYVGSPRDSSTTRNVHVFGDSFVFGEGVNDEQTFTYLLQSHFPNTRFQLHAASGWSLTNAYLNYRRLAEQIGPDDIIILGYAKFYDVRHVAAPSRIRYWGEPSAEGAHPEQFKHLRAQLAGDRLVFDRIPLFCAYSGGYCDQPDPSDAYMHEVTARIINGIAKSTSAKVYLLHFLGPLSEEIRERLDRKVRIVHATPESYDYEMRDDINGFDGHPGPYWNHAIYRRLADTLQMAGLR